MVKRMVVMFVALAGLGLVIWYVFFRGSKGGLPMKDKMTEKVAAVESPPGSRPPSISAPGPMGGQPVSRIRGRLAELDARREQRLASIGIPPKELPRAIVPVGGPKRRPSVLGREVQI